MICNKCGNYVNPEKKFCSRCGSPLETSVGYARPINARPINAAPINARPVTRRPAVAYAGAASSGSPSYYERGYQIISRPAPTYTAPVCTAPSPIRRRPEPVYRGTAELSGLLQFLVVMFKIISPMLIIASLGFYTSKILRAIYQMQDINSVYNYFGYNVNYYDKLTTYLLTTLGFVAFACITGAIVISAFGRKIEKRDPGFLRMFQKLYITISVILLAIPFINPMIYAFTFGIDPVFNITNIIITDIGYLICQIIGFTLWNLYFTKSKKVYEYMGSDEYLRKSLFNKNTLPPV